MKISVDLKRDIGTVVLIVEGEKGEPELLTQIFGGILRYKLVRKTRLDDDFVECNEYASEENEFSRVIIVNTGASCAKSVFEEEYRDELHDFLNKKYGVDLTDARVYYIWDRDHDSNRVGVIRTALEGFYNAQGNENFENGLFLLSYPCSESYIISCFEKGVDVLDGKIKEYVEEKGYCVEDIDAERLKTATVEMMEALGRMGVENFSVDDMKRVNLEILDKEENFYHANGHKYRHLSLITATLLDLGIITVEDEVDMV